MRRCADQRATDTGGKEEGSRAREFLEKFVTIKLSLFVDSSSIRDFLKRDWQRPENQIVSIPSETMLKLSAVLSELADILDGDLAAKYLPLVGDLRKIKRFVNAMLLMQLDKSALGRTDFNKRDLINLMLLHLNYPGLFRQIYAEETEGRSGTFSVRREYEDGGFIFKNSTEFPQVVVAHEGAAGFLLKQLFDLTTLELDTRGNVDEAVLAKRACFNHDSYRNLEGYLKLIVRFITPEPQETYVLYQDAVERVRNGEPVNSVLTSPDFQSEHKEYAHDQFWRMLVNQAYSLKSDVADEAINTLVNFIPHYSAISNGDRGLRQRSIYSLVILLDRAGWGRTEGRRRPNTPENVIEIAWRIFGEYSYEGKGLLQRLASRDRGVLGWDDLMMFRLQCSADRQQQLHNLYSALILNQDKNAATTGPVNNLTLMGMRRLSQEVFGMFKQTYIDQQRNFFAEVCDAPAELFLGEASSQSYSPTSMNGQSTQDSASLVHRISAARSAVKSFVTYQLSNSLPPTGAGVGCGYYDAFGTGDNKGIARLMNDYVFDVCFNPDVHEDNVLHFLDHCLSHLNSALFSENDDERYFASEADLPGGLDPIEMGRYWIKHREVLLQRTQQIGERYVFTLNYTASYFKHLAGVFSVLDKYVSRVIAVGAEGSGGLPNLS